MDNVCCSRYRLHNYLFYGWGISFGYVIHGDQLHIQLQLQRVRLFACVCVCAEFATAVAEQNQSEVES